MSTKRNQSATGHDGEHGHARRGRLRRRRGWAVLAAVAAAASSAAGVMVLAAGTVLAAEPAVTTQKLTGTNGATGDAGYLNSGTPTTVIKRYTNGFYAEPGHRLSHGTSRAPTTKVELVLERCATGACPVSPCRNPVVDHRPAPGCDELHRRS